MDKEKMELLDPKRNDKTYIKIGWNIAFYRKARGLTQMQLAELAGLSRTFMGHIEASKMPVSMSLETLLDISRALEIEPYKLFEFKT